jgi:hypothetical protein
MATINQYLEAAGLFVNGSRALPKKLSTMTAVTQQLEAVNAFVIDVASNGKSLGSSTRGPFTSLPNSDMKIVVTTSAVDFPLPPPLPQGLSLAPCVLSLRSHFEFVGMLFIIAVIAFVCLEVLWQVWRLFKLCWSGSKAAPRKQDLTPPQPDLQPPPAAASQSGGPANSALPLIPTMPTLPIFVIFDRINQATISTYPSKENEDDGGGGGGGGGAAAADDDNLIPYDEAGEECHRFQKSPGQYHHICPGQHTKPEGPPEPVISQVTIDQEQVKEAIKNALAEALPKKEIKKDVIAANSLSSDDLSKIFDMIVSVCKSNQADIDRTINNALSTALGKLFNEDLIKRALSFSLNSTVSGFFETMNWVPHMSQAPPQAISDPALLNTLSAALVDHCRKDPSLGKFFMVVMDTSNKVEELQRQLTEMDNAEGRSLVASLEQSRGNQMVKLRSLQGRLGKLSALADSDGQSSIGQLLNEVFRRLRMLQISRQVHRSEESLDIMESTIALLQEKVTELEKSDLRRRWPSKIKRRDRRPLSSDNSNDDNNDSGGALSRKPLRETSSSNPKAGQASGSNAGNNSKPKPASKARNSPKTLSTTDDIVTPSCLDGTRDTRANESNIREGLARNLVSQEGTAPVAPPVAPPMAPPVAPPGAAIPRLSAPDMAAHDNFVMTSLSGLMNLKVPIVESAPQSKHDDKPTAQAKAAEKPALDANRLPKQVVPVQNDDQKTNEEQGVGNNSGKDLWREQANMPGQSSDEEDLYGASEPEDRIRRNAQSTASRSPLVTPKAIDNLIDSFVQEAKLGNEVGVQGPKKIRKAQDLQKIQTRKPKKPKA